VEPRLSSLTKASSTRQAVWQDSVLTNGRLFTQESAATTFNRLWDLHLPPELRRQVLQPDNVFQSAGVVKSTTDG
jgi:hypothetical protein